MHTKSKKEKKKKKLFFFYSCLLLAIINLRLIFKYFNKNTCFLYFCIETTTNNSNNSLFSCYL